MQDVAESILIQLRLADHPSRFELRVLSREGPSCLTVRAPVRDGRQIFEVFFGEDSHVSPPHPNEGSLSFEHAHWEGGVAFVDGYMKTNWLTSVELIRSFTPEDGWGETLAEWSIDYPDTTFGGQYPPQEASAAAQTARLAVIRGAFQALLG